MGVVDDHAKVFGALQILQPSRGRFQAGQRHQRLLCIHAQAYGRGVDGQEVVGVVLANQAHPGFHAVYLKLHALEALLQDAGGMVGQSLYGVGDHLRLGVLHHHGAVAVIGIDEGDGALGQIVKEQFLAAEVFGKGLMVVQMVVRKVGEDAHAEVQARNAVLLHADGANLHEAILAAGIHHLGQEAVDGNGIGRGVLRLQPPALCQACPPLPDPLLLVF